MLEKRRFIRIPDNSIISYQLLTTAKIEDYVTEDISQGGVKFFLHEFVPKGSLLKIKISFEKMHLSIESLVKVAWIREDTLGQRYEAGVEFVEMPQEAARYLVKYIKAFLEATVRP